MKRIIKVRRASIELDLKVIIQLNLSGKGFFILCPELGLCSAGSTLDEALDAMSALLLPMFGRITCNRLGELLGGTRA